MRVIFVREMVDVDGVMAKRSSAYFLLPLHLLPIRFGAVRMSKF